MSVLNLQVAAGADDGYNSVALGFSAVDLITAVGDASGVIDSWHRFEGVSGLAGATINSAVLSLWIDSLLASTPVLTNVYAEAAAAPAAPTDGADFAARTRTTAFVAWDDMDVPVGVVKESPDLSDVIQELADSLDPTVIQIFHEDDGSSGSNAFTAAAYDGTPANAAQLDIDYTAAAPAVTSRAAIARPVASPLTSNIAYPLT